MTIQEYLQKDIEEHPEIADQRILIDAAYDLDLCDPMRKTLYDGSIRDLPEEYLDEEILESGWSIARQTVAVTVLRNLSKKVAKI